MESEFCFQWLPQESKPKIGIPNQDLRNMPNTSSTQQPTGRLPEYQWEIGLPVGGGGMGWCTVSSTTTIPHAIGLAARSSPLENGRRMRCPLTRILGPRRVPDQELGQCTLVAWSDVDESREKVENKDRDDEHQELSRNLPCNNIKDDCRVD